MDDLIKLLVSKLGLSEDMARQAVTLILGQLKDKLPAPIAGQLESLMNGSVGLDDIGGSEGLLEKGKDLLGGLFGGKS